MRKPAFERARSSGLSEGEEVEGKKEARNDRNESPYVDISDFCCFLTYVDINGFDCFRS